MKTVCTEIITPVTNSQGEKKKVGLPCWHWLASSQIQGSFWKVGWGCRARGSFPVIAMPKSYMPWTQVYPVDGALW